jgi:DhnA family fructose-bisphosphate aldolase class Ia
MVDGDAEKIVTLTRLAREMGADIVKADPTTNPEDFHRVVEAARCPVLARGGGKEDLRAVFDKSAALIAQGAMGMVYGRNIYQHANPGAVVRGLMALIHDGASGADALAIYERG